MSTITFLDRDHKNRTGEFLRYVERGKFKGCALIRYDGMTLKIKPKFIKSINVLPNKQKVTKDNRSLQLILI